MTTKWPTRPISYDELGGEKSDYLDVVDPTTDRSSEEVNTAFLATSMMSNTMVQAVCSFSGTGVGPIVPFFHRALWGSTISVIPTITVPSTGRFKVTFPEDFVDEQGDTVDVNLHAAWVSFNGLDWNNKPLAASARPDGPNAFVVAVTDYTGSLTHATGSVINVFAF